MFGVILLPNFALQAVLRHRAKDEDARKPMAVLCEATAAKQTIAESNEVALAAGVRIGMTATQGLARCPALVILSKSSAQEAVLSKILLESTFACSPWVETTADGVCTFELRDAHHPATALAERAVAYLASLGLAARVGMATSPDLARLAAQAARPCLVVNEATSFLGDLPISVLEPTAPILAILQRWGIGTLGALSALSPQEVIRRLGAEGRSLWERAAGRQQRLLYLVSPPVIYEETLDFDYEVQTLEPLLFVLRRFLDQLVLRLNAIYRVPATLDLDLSFDDGQSYHRHFVIPAPTNHVETLFRVLHTHLENFTAPSPVRRLRLAATPVLAAREQFGLFETALRNPNRFGETLARLYALLGSERTGIACCEDTYRPDAFHLESPDFLRLAETVPEKTAALLDSPPSFGLPLRRLRPPLALQVEVSRRVPVRVQSGLVTGEVCAARGPYQLLGGWWEPGGWVTEEWDVEVQGSLYRLCRQPEGWFVAGIYD